MARAPIFVVHKKPKQRKYTLTKIENKLVDQVLAENKRKPLIPYEHEIEKIGVGSIFEDRYKKEYGKKLRKD